ncbi:Cof-type HAD-IIB family hydrolase [Anaerococcus vaginalis]|uniref:Cof-type HAD-IIB family hydrolase n=1 Tax=Anaerococcus vaginalis TaxID=33037 RepID=UPI00290EC45D|nr:Cof-type HAD-IIB family hydrolase [Anaerococcus vaginalis]MDU5560389.1 Cof-type HAD-IIB family hydrolase [Anaerococcus vaginalis]
MKKIIAVDIDGTLLNSKRQITEKTKNALIKAQELGHIVVIASGRDPLGVYPFADILEFKKYGGLISNFNGGRITNYKTKDVIINHPMDFDLAKEILQFSEKNLFMHYIIYTEDKIITSSSKTYKLEEICQKAFTHYEVIDDLAYSLDFAPNKILFSQDPNLIDDDAKKLMDKFSDKTTQVKSTPYFYEIMPKGIGKGESLVEIAKYFDMDMKDVIAFGDEENDQTMIEMAGLGVVMENGANFMKEKADFITKSNDDDGIAYYLEKFVFNEK